MKLSAFTPPLKRQPQLPNPRYSNMPKLVFGIRRVVFKRLYFGQEKTPFRVAITGVDGAGKSTTGRMVAEKLGQDLDLISPGPSRPVYSIIDRKKRYHFPNFVKWIDRLHGHADRARNTLAVGAVNTVNVTYAARHIEPSLIHQYHPDLILGERDFYIDPAVYATIYQPKLGKKPVAERIQFLRRLLNVPVRDLIFFLKVPADAAIVRITARMEQEQQVTGVSDRDKWRHMHEDPETLHKLQQEFSRVLAHVRKISPAHIVEIDTEHLPQSQVAEMIEETIRNSLRTMPGGKAS